MQRSLCVLLLCLLAVFAATAGVSAAPAAPRPSDSVPQLAPVAAAKPHPILSDLRVRKAVAYCTDKMGLVNSLYGNLTPQQRQALISDSFVLPSSWAYTPPGTVYPFAPDTGRTLLDEAGWTLAPGDTYRTRGGKELALVLRTTTSGARKTFLAVFEEQMKACGLHIIREHLPAAWFFGDGTGVSVRDFEVADFAWVLESEPGGRTLWACDQIPTPENGWKGQNYPGWCNESASNAILIASDVTKSHAERKAAYAVVTDAIAAEVPSLPLFFYWNPDIGAPTETMEHIDFNLETFSQEAEVSPTGQTVLATSDYDGNAGTVIVPAGAVPQANSLSYYPLVAPSKSAPEGDSVAAPFRLTAMASGVPQANLQPAAPLTVTMRYQDAGIPYLDETTLDLYGWSPEAGWRRATDSCPPHDRYHQVDRTTNTLTVRVCSLGEFTMLGDTIPYWPLAVGNGWRYAWNNTQYAPDGVSETLWVAGKSGTDFRLRGTSPYGASGAVAYTAYGLSLGDVTTSDTNPFPKPMNALLSHIGVVSQLLPGQWQVGDEVAYGAYVDEVYYPGLTRIVSITESVDALGVTYANCLKLVTTITGDVPDFVTGTRTLWFAPDVGLVKMVYEHGDGTVTKAELLETIRVPVVRLPLVQGK